MQVRASKQPIHITGTIRHCYLWVTSSCNSEVLHNQAYENALEKPKDPIAIFCVHGTADRASAFKLVGERLLNQLPEEVAAIYLLAFEHRGEGKEIPEFSQQLLDAILKSGYKRVILMGHSRGGLVCAWFEVMMSKLNGIDVQSVHAVASPFGGSDKAIWPLSFISDSVEQMSINSLFLQDLIPKIQKSTVPYYYYAAEKDELVSLSSTYVPGGEKNLTFLRCHNHLSIMSSWKMVEQMRKRIANEDCGLSLITIQSELGIYLEDFKEAFHVFSGEFKQKILEKLIHSFDLIARNQDDGRYIEAKSMGEYLLAFLEDKTLLVGGAPVKQALNASLINPLMWSNTSTMNFLESLCVRYKDILLPVRSGQTLEIANETQSQLRNV